MKQPLHLLTLLFLSLLIIGCSDKKENTPDIGFKLDEITIDGNSNLASYDDVDPNLAIILSFSADVDRSTVNANITLKKENGQIPIPLEFSYEDNKTVLVQVASTLKEYTSYQFILGANIKSVTGDKILTGKVYKISTGNDDSDKFPRIPDDELLDLVQKQTFKYFWDFGHPTSGMTRERSTSGNTVTTGGTGFGVMAMIVATEKQFITRNQAVERIQKIVTFLETKATRYHGAYPHWINGETGETMPFSTYDNGADLVETALLFQGLLSARTYFKLANSTETKLRNDITKLWREIEWTWFQRGGQNVLYWHWSLEHEWQVNLKVSGWNESLIVYVLAASSPTFPISKTVYDEGWARNGAMTNGNAYYGYTLPLGIANGGPLFLSQYSFLGINPKGLTDQYVDYWIQNRNHTLINYSYCVSNPKGYKGYGATCWGLTASDGNTGYSAHSPSNDRGVIAPTAALSAMPYTPIESMAALHHFYYKLGDKLWKEYGFVDAFNQDAKWFDNQFLAIDQGPIILMIENHRTGLLWSTFMADPEIKNGMKSLGFKSPNL